MCRLAIADDRFFEVSDIELTRQGPSYTLVTARELKRQGWDRVNWLIGADMVQILPRWHQPYALLREVHFVLMARPGWSLDWQSLPPAYRHLEERVIPAPLIELSATGVRHRLASGRSIRYLVPLAVEEYLRDNGLYQ